MTHLDTDKYIDCIEFLSHRTILSVLVRRHFRVMMGGNYV